MLKLRHAIAVVAVAAVLALLAGTLPAQARHVIRGTRGNDRIHGNRESDAGTHGNPSQTIMALAGRDHVYGGKGRDYVYGGAGADMLNAFHASRGLLNGGPGRDRCVVGDNSRITLRSCEVVVTRGSQGDGGNGGHR